MCRQFRCLHPAVNDNTKGSKSKVKKFRATAWQEREDEENCENTQSVQVSHAMAESGCIAQVMGSHSSSDLNSSGQVPRGIT
jgi:hypothetical protein